ncbi:HAD hydrolase family protein [Streptococcus sciuri]|uniref:HAD hydrolase family protein n=1 Tax=Streptococcus sciuri TaxID=2973939 RepID=A0ABT2F8W7_9STRE|nr:HAD hydrolase family protein [Streptococcus sciuri]MCS4488926.1 HAD hydrolase family protein [Streptococcus sciuri]
MPVYRDTLIHYNEPIYFDDIQNAWIVTEKHYFEAIVQNPNFSSDRLGVKLRNSFIDDALAHRLKVFYDDWIMYQDSDKNKLSRCLSSTLLNSMNKLLSISDVQKIIREEVELSTSKIDFAMMIEKACERIITQLYDLPVERYRTILKLSRPITNILYTNSIELKDAQEAAHAIEKVEEYVLRDCQKMHNHSLVAHLVKQSQVPISLVINLLVDGQDLLESFLKTVVYLWASKGLSDYKNDISYIQKYFPPFTSLSRICLRDTTVGKCTIREGERVLCILSSPEDASVMAFGVAGHRCLGEDIAMKIARQLYLYLKQLGKAELCSCKTNKSFGYFTFTELMIRKRKKFIFDLDGTIVFNGRFIAPELKTALRRLNDKYELLFASARPIRDMLPLLRDFKDNDLIGANGAMVRQNGTIKLIRYIDSQVVSDIMTVVFEDKLDFIIDYEWHYTASISESNHPILVKLDSGNLANNVPVSYRNVGKIIILGINSKIINCIQNIKGIEYVIHNDDREIVITSEGINKYTAIKYLINDNKYIAFGNDKNDIEMLNYSEKGYLLNEKIKIGRHVTKISKKDIERVISSYV